MVSRPLQNFIKDYHSNGPGGFFTVFGKLIKYKKLALICLLKILIQSRLKLNLTVKAAKNNELNLARFLENSEME